MRRPTATPRPMALVTGASSGIGAAFARRLAREGYDLVLVARRAERLAELAGELGTEGGATAEPFPADLTREEDLARVEERIRGEERLCLLVNNAGFGSKGWFWEADAEGQDRMHRLHVLATVRLTRAALPGMVARGTGAVIQVSSVAGFGTSPGNASYCATKAWMNRFAEGLSLELSAAGFPVQVQALCPGFTETEFHERLGMDRSFVSRGWWMTAEDVVEASLRGLRRGRTVVVPGLRYRAAVVLMKLLPSAILEAVVGRRAARRGKIP